MLSILGKLISKIDISMKHLVKYMCLYAQDYFYKIIFNKTLPRIFAVEVNVNCNLKCPECPLGSGSITRKKGHLSFDQFKVIADKTKSYSRLMYIMLWGEPLLNSEIIRMIKYASTFTNTSISTNGMLLTDRLAEDLITSGLSELIISIDGVSQSVYGAYRVGGNVFKVLDSLKMLVKYNAKYGFPVRIIPQFIVFSHNIHEMSEFKKICNTYNLEPSFKAPYIREGRLLKESDDLSFVRKKYKNMRDLSRAMTHCQNARTVFTTLLDGSVVACCYDYNGVTTFGNIFTQDVMEIWTSDNYVSFRTQILSNKPPKFCTDNCLLYMIEPVTKATDPAPQERTLG